MIKRLFDIGASFIGLILLLPVFVILGLLVRIIMGKPVLFKQERVGRYGLPFVIYKFRTMRESHHGGYVSIKGESRITPLGGILRKFKLDELPELYNVLIGNMSFVGPRPNLREYTDQLNSEERKILQLRPGITGPATLKYAEEEEILSTIQDPQTYHDKVIWPDKVRIDLDYFHNRTFLCDMEILIRTVFRITAP